MNFNACYWLSDRVLWGHSISTNEYQLNTMDNSTELFISWAKTTPLRKIMKPKFYSIRNIQFLMYTYPGYMSEKLYWRTCLCNYLHLFLFPSAGNSFDRNLCSLGAKWLNNIKVKIALLKMSKFWLLQSSYILEAAFHSCIPLNYCVNMTEIVFHYLVIRILLKIFYWPMAWTYYHADHSVIAFLVLVTSTKWLF